MFVAKNTKFSDNKVQGAMFLDRCPNTNLLLPKDGIKAKYKCNNPGLLKESEREARKEQKLYTFNKLVKDLEPYSLYPREEIVRLLKMAFFLILTATLKKQFVRLPYLGVFGILFRKSCEFTNPRSMKPTEVQWNPIRFTPSIFYKWMADPKRVSVQRYVKARKYFVILEDLKKQFHFHGTEWIKQFVPGDEIKEYVDNKCVGKLEANQPGYNLKSRRKAFEKSYS